MARLTLRLDFSAGRLGPGKIRLLELIVSKGSISAAARAMGMSYRRAWLLVDSLNQMFREPAVVGKVGGMEGGGAVLTPFGHELLRLYREMERDARLCLDSRIATLEAAETPTNAASTDTGPPQT